MAHDDFAELRDAEWHLASWQRRPALVSRSGRRKELYTGQNYDPVRSEIVDRGWDHDHCETCWATISNDRYENEFPEAYTDGMRWLCPDCYERMKSSAPERAA